MNVAAMLALQVGMIFAVVWMAHEAVATHTVAQIDRVALAMAIQPPGR